ncbi:protein ripply2 [Onychostruthus taczanowskii]|uniref:protein ripply2 n=1 Tax=Onychostruthus taczanowskii TaxID=356909 RepID=UPI001B80A283|nr:protein ripply2 [Onychostruthus taczanowskii]
MSRGRWGLRAAQRPPPAIKASGPAGSSDKRAAADRRRMEGGCPCPLSATLPPQGYSPLSSSRCGGRPGPALTALPSPRSPAPFWRPWVPAPAEAARRSPGPAAPHSPGGMAEASRKLAQYTHPVRLFWPKSRCYDYLYQEAEALLKNFPVQATISFYEDSESEDDEDQLEQDSRTESGC